MLQEMVKEAVRELASEVGDTAWDIAIRAMEIIACEVDGSAATSVCVANALEHLVQMATDMVAPADEKKLVITEVRELISVLRTESAKVKS